VSKVVQAVFEKFGAGPISWGGLTAPGGQIQEGSSKHPGQTEHVFALCCIPMLHRCIDSGGVCFGSEVACICAGGALCVVRALDW
jgi:hypothetical protein